MCDVFDPQLPDPWRHQVDQLIHDTPHLRWLLLTKRPEQMQRYIEVWWKNKAPRQNVWLGVSVTNQADANARVPLLLETPAAGRFVSCEPLVGAVDLRWWLRERYWEIEQPAIPGLDWVIAGGMSGPDAVPTHPDWVRSLRDQCATADVPFLFKQWGEWYAVGLFEPQHRDDQWFRIDGAAWRMRRRGKKAAGRVLDGKVWDQVPEWKGENDEGC
jgi:protein gp37